jgi:Cu(I)/Ag(I) efflux system membrane fusion protein
MDLVPKKKPRAAFACPMHLEETSDEPGRCSVCKMDLVPQLKAQGAYVCPMHPEEASEEPGHCSICKMELSPVAPAQQPIAVHVHHRTYACPMHVEQTSDEPGRCSICKMDLALQKPERLFACPMHTKETSDSPCACPICGSAMKKIADMRARRALPPSVPGFESASWNWEAFPTRSVPTSDGKPRIARPTKRFTVEDVRAAAWCDELERVFAVIYEDELVGLQPGDRGTFHRFESPETPIPVTLSELEPRKWDHVTFSLVFHVDQAAGEHREHSDHAAHLRVGDTGWVEMPDRPRALLSIPEDALLMSGRERYVVLALADGGFLRRQVHVGTFDNGYAALLEGLTEHDSVVVGNAFFPDVERIERPTIGEDNQEEDAFFTGDRRSSTIGDH